MIAIGRWFNLVGCCHDSFCLFVLTSYRGWHLYHMIVRLRPFLYDYIMVLKYPELDYFEFNLVTGLFATDGEKAGAENNKRGGFRPMPVSVSKLFEKVFVLKPYKSDLA